MAKSGGGITSKNVRRVEQRTGKPARRVHVPRANELGNHVGDHVTERGGKGTGYKGERPLIRNSMNSVPLGNERTAPNGPKGQGRTTYARGYQGQHGAAAAGNPPPKGNVFTGWEGKR